MSEATIYMTDGNEYVVEYDMMEHDYTTIRFYSNDGSFNMFSKFNMICMVVKEQNNE